MSNITKKEKLSKRCKVSKKVIINVVTMAVMCCLKCIDAFAAATGNVDTSTFITSACTVLKSVISLIGAGVAVWGVVNLLEGYGNDNPGAKSQGMKQLMSGLGMILLGLVLVPVLQDMMTGATTTA